MTRRAALLIALAATTCLGSALPAAGQASRSRPPVPVIISSDVATGLVGGWRGGPSDIDDGFAVGMALGLAGLDVRGIVVTLGNNNVQPEVAVAQRIVRDLLHRQEVPVLSGSSQRLTDPAVAWYDHQPLPAECVNEGVRFMADQLRGRRLTILAIGPLTDIACLVLNYPREAAHVVEVVAIMGRRPGEQFELRGKTGLTDFNYVRDERAARVLLESKVPLTFLTFDLTKSALVPRAAVEDLRQRSSPAAKFFYEAAQPWLEFWKNTFAEDGFHPWDQNAIYFAVNPAAFVCAAAAPTVVPCAGTPYHNADPNRCPGHGPGQKHSLDKEASQLWLDPAGTPKRVKVCTAYASPASKASFLDSLFAFLPR
jgi:pyrimidine-specific ribonucleoside hydrolase